MKNFYYLFVLFLLTCGLTAKAQTTREQAEEARTLYLQANASPAGLALRTSLSQQPGGFLGKGDFQTGALRTFDGRYLPVPGLRYSTSLHLLEAQDSLNTDLTHLWPLGSLRGFDLGEAGGTGELALRRFRSRLVHATGGTHREFVEVLTMTDAGPLLLAWLHNPSPDAAGKAQLPILMVGSGRSAAEPLRPLDLTQTTVLRLLGARAEAVRTYATGEHLRFDQPAEVARMLDYYNRVAVVE